MFMTKEWVIFAVEVRINHRLFLIARLFLGTLIRDREFFHFGISGDLGGALGKSPDGGQFKIVPEVAYWLPKPFTPLNT